MPKPPTVQRAKVAPAASHGGYRQQLRRDFWFSCGYCTISEAEAAGIGFEIDHYEPASQSPERRADYDNLIYACERCNQKKLDWVPASLDLSRSSALPYFRPDWEHEDDHFESSVDGSITSPTAVGRFTIEVLELYRHALKELRKDRSAWLALAQERRRVANGIRALRSLPIDQLPQGVRHKLVRFQTLVAADAQSIDVALSADLAALGRSSLLDAAPTQTADNARRRNYLKRIGAVRARNLPKSSAKLRSPASTTPPTQSDKDT